MQLATPRGTWHAKQCAAEAWKMCKIMVAYWRIFARSDLQIAVTFASLTRVVINVEVTIHEILVHALKKMKMWYL